MDNGRPQAFLLYLRTGGGHLAPAQSIATELGRAGIDPVLVDGLTESSRFARTIIEDGYRTLQARARWYYELLYAVNKVPLMARWNCWLVDRQVRDYLERRILVERPSVIVVFHFFLVRPVHAIVRRHSLTVPVVTVVTDPYTAHPMWFLIRNQQLVVFSEKLKHHCIAKGIPAEQISVFPFILSERFSTLLPEAELPRIRTRLGFTPGEKIVLLLGGADGIPRGEAILRRLVDAQIPARIAIVCGRNASLHRHATAIAARHPGRVTVYGFVDFVYDLISIADIVVTKCGASTFMEIIMLRKVPVITNYLWEQEKGNVDFLVGNGLGLYEKRIRHLPTLLRRLLEDRSYYTAFVDNIVRRDIRNGTADVAGHIASMVHR